MNGYYFDKWSDLPQTPVDINGDPVRRPKSSYPYSYSRFVVWKGNYKRTDSVVDHDRMMQWDIDKFSRCCKEAFGDKGQMFYSRAPKDIEKFLSLYFGEDIELTGIEEGCNVSTGYPIWSFYYRRKNDKGEA